MTTPRTLTLAAAIGFVCLGSASARPTTALHGPLADLAAPRDGTPKHEGSWNRQGNNFDFVGVGPGSTITLLDYKGAGIVRRFWMTLFHRTEVTSHRQIILRMYWDGETSPSVEVPVGDFFGVGFGESRDYVSLPLSETSGGYNCYWPMPFHRSARGTLTNTSNVNELVWFNIDFTAYDRLPRGLRHFHAQWRRENPTTSGKSYAVLEAAGRGHFVGTALFMQNRRPSSAGFGPLGFLEGDEMIYVDGETTPAVVGSGTEDYFGGGFYFDRGSIATPYHGVVIKDEALARVSAYRWHVEDAMPFTRSIRVTIEHGGANDYEGDYSSVAFFYQSEPHAPFPPFPTDPNLLLPFQPPAP